ncbi:MAG: putative phosphatase [Nevskia sp.]|nr:putative phosphatase [Nevskia sp.]
MSAALSVRDQLLPASAYGGERLLIFDAESLLLDPTQGIQHSLLGALQQLGRRLPDHAFRHWSLRTPLREALAILMDCRDPQQLDQACDCFFQHYEQSGRFCCSLRPGALALLNTLAGDARFELHYLTHIGAQAAARLLDVYGFGKFVRSIFTSEAPTCPGVRPHLMQQLVASSCQPPSRWVLLSDHPYELMTAQELHLRSIALGYGRAPLPTLLQLDPSAIAADLPDVSAQLDELLHPPCRRQLQLPMHSHSIN